MAETKIDPFAHVVDSSHGDILPTAGLTFSWGEINGIPLKFYILMTVSAVTVAWILLFLSRKMRSGEPPSGKLWNLLESILFFVRNKIARAGIGEHDADKYLPYLTTLCLFIFAMNLIGLLPFMGSPTAAITVTGALALVSFVIIHTAGIKSNGFNGYLKTFIPHIEMQGGPFMQFMGKGITFGMAILEYLTAFIRAGVLAVRLFANMLAGHTVLYMILLFIALVDDPALQIDFVKSKSSSMQNAMWFLTSIFSVVLATVLNLLEIFIAGLQAFIFTFLTAVFIGLAKHPPH
jgi:F-type H+-transporting ATPase subunit a